MNNEDRILAMLEQLTADMAIVKTDIATVKTDLADLKREQSEIKKSVDAVYDQTANLTVYKTETETEIQDIRAVLKQNAYDIQRLKAASGK